jgi:hypothetical protein
LSFSVEHPKVFGYMALKKNHSLTPHSSYSSTSKRFIAGFGSLWEIILSSLAPMKKTADLNATEEGGATQPLFESDNSSCDDEEGKTKTAVDPHRHHQSETDFPHHPSHPQHHHHHLAGEMARKGEPETGPFDMLPLSSIRSHKTGGGSSSSTSSNRSHGNTTTAATAAATATSATHAALVVSSVDPSTAQTPRQS